MLHLPLTSPAIYGNHDPMDLINETSQNIADRLTWHTANRDQTVRKECAKRNAQRGTGLNLGVSFFICLWQ